LPSPGRRSAERSSGSWRSYPGSCIMGAGPVVNPDSRECAPIIRKRRDPLMSAEGRVHNVVPKHYLRNQHGHPKAGHPGAARRRSGGRSALPRPRLARPRCVGGASGASRRVGPAPPSPRSTPAGVRPPPSGRSRAGTVHPRRGGARRVGHHGASLGRPGGGPRRSRVVAVRGLRGRGSGAARRAGGRASTPLLPPPRRAGFVHAVAKAGERRVGRSAVVRRRAGQPPVPAVGSPRSRRSRRLMPGAAHDRIPRTPVDISEGNHAFGELARREPYFCGSRCLPDFRETRNE